MASLELKKNSYEVTGKMMLVDYDTDVWLTRVQLSKNGIDFIDALAFSQLTAMFDLTEWDNGDYNDCILRGHYDDIAIFTSMDSVMINEKEKMELKVFLDREPSNNITITLNIENTSIASIDKTSLTFTKENYNVAQTIVITGAYNTDDKDFSTNLLLSIAGEVVKTVPISIKNIDIKYGAISIGKTSLSINEGSSSTVGVSLASRPTNNQNVTITKNNNNITLDKTTLTFTPNNYSTVQNIKITGVYDDSTLDKTSIVTFASENVSSKTLNVKVVNTDSYGEIVLSTTSLSFNEGSSSSFTVKLDKAPSKNQVVTIAKGEGISLNKTSLTFTPSNYNTAQKVTITSTEDIDSYRDKAITITLTSPKVSTKTVNVTLKNITQSQYANVITDVSSITVNELATFALSIKLDKAPSQNQTVTISKNNNFISLNKTSLTFTPSNYNTYQKVVVTGVSDTSSFVDKTSVITLSSFNGDVNINVTIKNIDKRTYSVTRNTNNCSNSNETNLVYEDSSYTNTITPNTGYEIESIKVTMGGTDITSSVLSGNKINISKVTGAITIVVTTKAVAVVLYPTLVSGYITSGGELISGGNYYIRTELIPVSEYSKVTINLESASDATYDLESFIVYDSNKSKIYYEYGEGSSLVYSFPSNAAYIAFDVDAMVSTLSDIRAKVTLNY